MLKLKKGRPKYRSDVFRIGTPAIFSGYVFAFVYLVVDSELLVVWEILLTVAVVAPSIPALLRCQQVGLELTEEALVRTTFWRTRHYPWEEIVSAEVFINAFLMKELRLEFRYRPNAIGKDAYQALPLPKKLVATTNHIGLDEFRAFPWSKYIENEVVPAINEAARRAHPT